MNLAVQIQTTSRVQLPHENDDHVFLGINGKLRVKKSSPTERAGRAQFMQWCLDAINPKAEAKGPVTTDVAKLVVRHQFRRFAAEQAHIAELSSLQHHL